MTRRSPRPLPGSTLRTPPPIIVAVSALVVSLFSPALTRADTVVGTGSAGSCTEAALDAALDAGGKITFNCGSGPTTVTITTAKSVGVDTNIDGGNLITISGGGLKQIFRVSSAAVLSLSNLAIVDSNGSGAILNAGTLMVTNTAFTGNNAPHVGGGAIYNRSGVLTVTSSTFSNNSGLNGAIFNAGTSTVIDSTFTNNTANYGGAVFNAGTLSVSGSTFAGNHANYDGGAIYNGDVAALTVSNSTFASNRANSGSGGVVFNANVGTIDMINATISGNSASGDGGAIANPHGTATLTNTIVTDNLADSCSGTIADGGHNLDDSISCGFSVTNASLSSVDPKLDPAGPRNNGGPTDTIALLADSPAIAAGDDSICTAAPVKDLDQRGFVRPGAGHTHCSIGAYEADAALPPSCTGDCDHSRSVTVDELLTMVNIALGNAAVSDCLAGDSNHDNQITIDEILVAVTNGLNGCPAA